MTCAVCSRPIAAGGAGDPPVHAECLAAGLLRDALLAVAETLALAAATAVIVWAG
jgi:hypothetical protein